MTKQEASRLINRMSREQREHLERQLQLHRLAAGFGHGTVIDRELLEHVRVKLAD